MEKYFIVSESANFYKEYFKHKEFEKYIHPITLDFMKKHNIEANEHFHNEKIFCIKPTEKDLEKFNTILGKSLQNGTRPFKKNSKIGKDWLATLKTNNVKYVYKPFVGFSFKNVMGKMRSRLFNIDSVVYCSFASDYEIDIPDGFREIKASEFFKVVEDNS